MSLLNLYICPGCNAELTPDNTGCPYCEYGVDHGLLADDAEFWPEHVPSLSWWLHTSKIENHEEMGDVCMGFVRRLLMEIQGTDSTNPEE